MTEEAAAADELAGFFPMPELCVRCGMRPARPGMVLRWCSVCEGGEGESESEGESGSRRKTAAEVARSKRRGHWNTALKKSGVPRDLAVMRWIRDNPGEECPDVLGDHYAEIRSASAIKFEEIYQAAEESYRAFLEKRGLKDGEGSGKEDPQMERLIEMAERWLEENCPNNPNKKES